MNSTGFTLSFRSKWEHPIFRNKQEAAVWAWMCDAAQWMDDRIGTKFGPIELKRGELIIAERVIAEDFGLHRNTVRDLINRMVSDGMITLARNRIPTRAGTIVKIEKYDDYQTISRHVSGPQTGPQTVAKRTAKGPQNNEEYQRVEDDFENDQDRKRTTNCTASETKNKEDKELKKEVREGKPSLGESAPPDPELFEGVEVVDAEVIAEPAEADPKVVRIADRQALLDKQFAEFWAAYPHKVGKQAAVKCYAKARKTASHDTIMHGLANALPAFSRCSETRFIPHPKTWLNEGRWDDVITTNGSSNYGRSGFNDRAERNGFLGLDRAIESCAVRPN